MSTTVAHTPFEADPSALSHLDAKLQIIRDWVSAVAGGLRTGLYIYGTGGIGKSHTVLERLDALKAGYRLFNSRMTGKGLFKALQSSPDAVHVLEDMERLTNDKDAQGVLRSALWATQGRERIVTWTTATGGDEVFTFHGGIILLANRPLAALPELRALATRIAVYRLDVTDGELRAMLYELAAKGYRRDGKLVLEPEPCGEVARHLLAECQAARCPLDLRLLINAYGDYLLWESGKSGSHWHDLVSASVREAVAHFRHEIDASPAEEKKARRRQLVREIIGATADAKEQERQYIERTGHSRADFFRRKREIESGEFDAEG